MRRVAWWKVSYQQERNLGFLYQHSHQPKPTQKQGVTKLASKKLLPKSLSYFWK